MILLCVEKRLMKCPFSLVYENTTNITVCYNVKQISFPIGRNRRVLCINALAMDPSGVNFQTLLVD